MQKLTSLRRLIQLDIHFVIEKEARLHPANLKLVIATALTQLAL